MNFIDTATPTLYVREAEGQYRVASDAEVLTAGVAAIGRRFTRGVSCNSPAVVKEFLVHRFAGLDHEVFVGLMLDSQHRVIEVVDLASGTIDAATVYPREVVKAVLRYNAAAVIFAHNHPSGVPEPSAADRNLTERLKAALQCIDVRVLDHFVIGGTHSASFAERGWL